MIQNRAFLRRTVSIILILLLLFPFVPSLAQNVSAAGEKIVIVLDAGHGGYDGGAVGRVSGVPEKGLNLDVAQQLEGMLRALGADVVMTRTGDYALCDENPPIRKKLQDMQRRAEIIALNEADMVISVHMNEYAGRSESGPPSGSATAHRVARRRPERW